MTHKLARLPLHLYLIALLKDFCLYYKENVTQALYPKPSIKTFPASLILSELIMSLGFKARKQLLHNQEDFDQLWWAVISPHISAVKP